MKRILVPVDFSSDSINALEHAIVLGNNMGANIRMIYVKKEENFEVPFHFEEFQDSFVHDVQEYFQKLVQRYESRYQVADGIMDFKIRQGTVYREIVNQAKYGDSFMIVMGAHGASGFEEFFIGSNSFKVVSHASCPVITLRNDFKREKVEHIVMPLDASSHTRKKIPLVAQLAALCKAHVHIVGVHESSDEMIISKIESYMDQAGDILSKSNVKFVKSLKRGTNNTQTAIQYARDVNADMIAIMTTQTQSSLNLFIGSYAQQMVNHSPIPVLCVPNN